jgi:hypothetical protein
VLCLAKTEQPDTTSFDAPEIVHRMKKHHHAGLIVRSENPRGSGNCWSSTASSLHSAF